MLFGHRHFGFRDARVECDRCVLPEGVFRRTLLQRVVIDESVISPAIGRGTEDVGRAKLLVLLEGRMLVTVRDCPREVVPGDLIGVSELDRLVCHGGDALTLTIDWPTTRAFEGASRLSLGELATLRDAAAALREADGRSERFVRIALAVRAVLGAEGIELDGFAECVERAAIDPVGQAYMTRLEHILSRIQDVPAAADWDGTRRTLTRRTHAVHRRYRLFGVRRGTDWRAVRDFHRLMTAAAFVTYPGASVAAVAEAVGYRSPAALCAAFAQVGLPSPAKVRERSIAP